MMMRLEVDDCVDRTEDVAKILESEEKKSKRATRSTGKRRSVVYRISSDEEEGATSAASASTSHQGYIKKMKGRKQEKRKREK